jgi:hypothetical protein
MIAWPNDARADGDERMLFALSSALGRRHSSFIVGARIRVTISNHRCQTGCDVSLKEKGRFMLVKMLKRTVVADKTVAHFCQIVCSIVSGLVLVFGVRRLAEMDLTESQLYIAMTGTLFLAGAFTILGFQCRAWTRAAQLGACA